MSSSKLKNRSSVLTLRVVDFVLWYSSNHLERFSFECRKVIGFALTTLRDWLKKLAPLFHPIRSKTKTNRDSLVRVFPHFTSATCNCFVFWKVHLIICVLCDYSGFGFTTLTWKPLYFKRWLCLPWTSNNSSALVNKRRAITNVEPFFVPFLSSSLIRNLSPTTA